MRATQCQLGAEHQQNQRKKEKKTKRTKTLVCIEELQPQSVCLFPSISSLGFAFARFVAARLLPLQLLLPGLARFASKSLANSNANASQLEVANEAPMAISGWPIKPAEKGTLLPRLRVLSLNLELRAGHYYIK